MFLYLLGYAVFITDLCPVVGIGSDNFFPGNEYLSNFENESNDDEAEEPSIWMLSAIIVISMALFMLFGLIKGLLGCFFDGVGNWMYNYLQPTRTYRESSRCRRFWINVLFCFLLPIVCCFNWLCCTCFVRQDKSESEAPIYERKIQHHEIDSDESDDGDGERKKLLRISLECSKLSRESFERFSETALTRNIQANLIERNDETVDSDVNFVINAMNESHESLCSLEDHQSEASLTNDSRFAEAKQLVHELIAARSVYRRFNKRIGFVKVEENQEFSIRGYFTPSERSSYQFVTFDPTKQFYEISNEITLFPLLPEIALDSKAFRRTYANKMEVLIANDLSVQPSSSAPCVNVLNQHLSMYGM